MVLLVVDTQRLITNVNLYNFEVFEDRVKSLIGHARSNNIEVIYVRHDDGDGYKLTKGEDGFEIYDEFKPDEEEIIFDKNVNSAFRGTGLLEYLRKRNENTIIIVGLQTEYCIDATIKCGFEHGFRMIVPANTNSTFDNEFMSAEMTYKYYNDFIWKKRYAECLSFEETLQMMKSIKMKNVVFLDIDGVLNSNFWNEGHQREISDGTLIDESKIKLLSELIKATDSKIILHSGWKYWFDSDLKPLCKEAENLIKLLEKVGLTIDGVTPDHSTKEIRKSKKFSLVKAGEILDWLKRHNDVDKWIVIDDLDLHNAEINNRQVRTDQSIGLTVEDVEKAKKMINDQEV